jgi:hypothetical protein
MPKLTTLKNNNKAYETLNKMIGSISVHQWMTDTLESINHQVEDLPWKRLLLRYEDDVRILAMHKSSSLRYHGCSILLYSQNEDSRRQLWEMFKDSDRSIRILMTHVFNSSDRHRLYNTLFKIYLNDPIQEVRKSAYNRIKKDFSDLYFINITALALEEKIHCLELLNIKSSHDHNLALQMMKDPQAAVVLAAGLYLEKAGTLDMLLRKARLSDLEDIERRSSLLKTASDHQLISFLEKKENLNNTGSLYIALSLYRSGSYSALFAWTLEQIFNLKSSKIIYTEMKEQALACLCSQKDPDNLILIRELMRCENKTTLPYLLENLPSEGSVIYYPILKNFLKDINFTFINSLFTAFKSIPLKLCLSDLYNIVRNNELNIVIRQRAVIILSSFSEYSCILFMLENLNLLQQEEMLDMASSLSSWNKVAFDNEVSIIFNQHDAALHQSLMKLLVTAGNNDFISEMEEKLLSAEAATRITALHSLQELNSVESIKKMSTLFYDSENLVQAHTASVFINWNREECFSEIQALLLDNLESPEIHNIILNAIEKSENRKLIPIVAELFKRDGIPQAQLIQALKGKRELEDISILTVFYGNSDKYAKECLQQLFKAMGEAAEKALLNLLSQNKTTSDIREILEKISYVDKLRAEQKSPFLNKRRDAVEALCRISTQNACRGLLSAARDISPEIRKMSLRTLSQAQESNGMLSLLKEDSDKKIKRLAFWAESKIEKAGTL